MNEEFTPLDVVKLRRIFEKNNIKKEKQRVEASKKRTDTISRKKDAASGVTSKTKINKYNPPLDWGKIDLNNKPSISFSPSRKVRARMIEVLDMDNKHRIRRELSGKLETEFLRLYTRYRRLLSTALERSKFRLSYETDTNRACAARAAELCIRFSVKPIDLFRYWHNRIGRLKWMHGISIPPLSFLSSNYAVATVSGVSKEDIELDPVDLIAGAFENSYSELCNLDPRLRKSLEKRGFNTNCYNDRELLSIQAAARSLACGYPIFIDDSILNMAKHLASTIYRDLKNEIRRRRS